MTDPKSYQQQIVETLDYMAVAVKEVNVANGWFDTDRSFGDEIALLHSEISEAFEAGRNHLMGRYCKNDVGQILPVEDGEEYPEGMKPEGVPSEIADELIRLLDFAYRHDIDLGKEFLAKLAYNRTRGHRHGGKAL